MSDINVYPGESLKTYSIRSLQQISSKLYLSIYYTGNTTPRLIITLDKGTEKEDLILAVSSLQNEVIFSGLEKNELDLLNDIKCPEEIRELFLESCNKIGLKYFDIECVVPIIASVRSWTIEPSNLFPKDEVDLYRNIILNREKEDPTIIDHFLLKDRVPPLDLIIPGYINTLFSYNYIENPNFIKKKLHEAVVIRTERTGLMYSIKMSYKGDSFYYTISAPKAILVRPVGDTLRLVKSCWCQPSSVSIKQFMDDSPIENYNLVDWLIGPWQSRSKIPLEGFELRTFKMKDTDKRNILQKLQGITKRTDSLKAEILTFKD